MKKSIERLSLAIYAIVAVLISGIFGLTKMTSTEPSVKVEPVQRQVVNEKTIREEWEENFMQDCLGTGSATYEYCSCTYDYFDSFMTTDELLEMELEYYRTRVFTQEMSDAVDYCSN